MPERERLLAICREWVVKAENDLTNAAHVLKLGEACPTDTVCFHAQQCVEKYVKAIALLPAKSRPRLTAEEQGRLTQYATGARYPGWGEIPLAEAHRALAIARRVRREVRGVLPQGVLRRGRP